MKANRPLFVIAVLLISILACNLQTGQENQPDLAGTITAQALTLQAPTATLTPAVTSTASGVEAGVTSVTNCRTGPSQAFDLIFAAQPGGSFKVVGKNTPSGYWIIENPAGGSCWLWGQYAVVSGDTSVLPEFPAPAAPPPKSTKTPKPTKEPKSSPAPSSTPAPTIPDPPVLASSSLNRTCEGYIDSDGFTPKWSESVNLTWQDNADNETGYRVYKNNSLVTTLPQDSTQFHITLRYTMGTGGPLYDTFGVEAFNEAGSSDRPALDVSRCP